MRRGTGLLACLVGAVLLAGLGGTPTVPVRRGDHESFVRLVFDWPLPVEYQLSQDAATVTLRFNEAGRPELKALLGDLPRFITAISSHPGSGETVVTLQLAPGARVRHFHDGTKVVVDVLGPSAGGKSPGPEASALDALRPAPKALPGDQPPPIPAPVPSKPATKPRLAVHAAEHATVAHHAPPSPAHPSPAHPSPPHPSPPHPSPPHPSPQGRLSPKKPARAEAPVPPPPPPPAPMAALPTGPRPLLALPAAPAPIPAPAAPAGQAGPPVVVDQADILSPESIPPITAPPIRVRFSEDTGVVALRFDWPQPVPAAAFRRGESVWVVFGAPALMDFAGRTASGMPTIPQTVTDASAFSGQAGTVVRLTVPRGINAALRPDGNIWTVELRDTGQRPAVPLRPQPRLASAGPELVVPVQGAGQPVVFKDPEVGDKLVVVPVFPPGGGLAADYVNPDLHLLPTAAGIAVAPLSQGLEVRSAADGVTITAAGGLHFSPEAVKPPVRPSQRLLDPAHWQRKEAGPYPVVREQLEKAEAIAPPLQRNPARLDLARYLFGNDFPAEAAALLRLAVHDDPEILQQPEILTLQGAAAAATGQDDEARAALTNPLIADDPEAQLWLGMVLQREGDAAGAARLFQEGLPVLAGYPGSVRRRVGLVIAKAGIQADQPQLAGAALEGLWKTSPTGGEFAQMLYLRGCIEAANGKTDEALADWSRLADSPYREPRAYSQLARLKLMSAAKKMTLADENEQLERLRYAWREGTYEMEVLQRLGENYLKAGDYRDGLNTLKQLVTTYSDRPGIDQVTQKMGEAFADLYIGPDTRKVPPITAIALFDEFRELTPAGPKGDEMIRRLADRLAAVDLLDRAELLLRQQIDYRLAGLEKVRVGGRLALLQILDHKPDEALKTLDGTEAAGVPDDLATQRRHLRIRALSDSGKDDDALQLLGSEAGDEADRLRYDLLWKTKRWAELGPVFQRMAGEAGKNGGLMPAEQRLVLNWAVALTFSGDNPGMAQLRDRFGGAMAKSPYANAFQLIAGNGRKGMLDYRTIPKEITEVQNFESFMEGYKTKLQNGQLSAIN